MTTNAQLQSAASLHASGDLAGAAEIYQQVLAVEPDQVDALRLRGLIFASDGKRQEACDYIRRAVTVNPGFAAGHSSLGLVLAEMGKFDEALAACERALQLDPNMAGAHCGLGLVLRGRGDMEGAIASLRKAISINPNAPMAYSNLGQLLGMKGELAESIHCYRKLCDLLPNQAKPLVQLAEAFKSAQFSQFEVKLKRDLLKCFFAEGVDYRMLGSPTASVLKLDPQFQPLIDICNSSKPGLPRDFLSEQTVTVLNDPLLLQLLQKCLVPDRSLERLLTRVRELILMLAVDDPQVLRTTLGPLTAFVYSLAQLCFFNEYIYAESDDEIAAVERLKSRVESISLPLEDTDKLLISLYACYRPLCHLSIADALAGAGFEREDAVFKELIKDQVINPLAEFRIRLDIPSLISHKDEITQAVQSQYEENPFPRWKNCTVRVPRSMEAEIKANCPNVEVSSKLNSASPEILIAGCGTGIQAVNCAYGIKNARITAVDLSLSSLAYARRMTAELGIDNIDYVHANILELDKLDKKFDFIECFGVLHHLSDPLRGWEVLVGLLKDEGIMMLGLYSEIARKAVVMSRDFIAEKSYSPTLEGIRTCRQELFETGDALVQENILSTGSAFWSASEVRDTIFHESEYRYTAPELADTIKRFGLEFLGFQHQRPVESAVYAGLFPDDPKGLCLQNWHEYEQKYPRTFSNCYHFWLRK